MDQGWQANLAMRVGEGSAWSIQLRSFQMAPKGSYREEHVIKFLSRWLPEWTDERASANEWRLLYLDSYSAHMTAEVQDLAFERGAHLHVSWWWYHGSDPSERH